MLNKRRERTKKNTADSTVYFPVESC